MLVDAGQGLAFPACDLAVATAIATARTLGVSFAGMTNSHHCGVLVDHLRAAADAGLVGLAFANSPAAMPAADMPSSAPTPWPRFSRGAAPTRC